MHAVRGDARARIRALHALLDKPDMPFSGWTIPIEPLLEPLRKLSRVSTGYRQARRARPLTARISPFFTLPSGLVTRLGRKVEPAIGPVPTTRTAGGPHVQNLSRSRCTSPSS